MSNIEDIRKHHGEKAAQKAAARQMQHLRGVADRYGRRVGIGDRVHVHMALDVLCEVLDVKPILDPRAPSGLVSLVFGATIEQHYQDGQVVPGLTRIWSAEQVARMEQAAASQGMSAEDADTRQEDTIEPAEPSAEPPAGGVSSVTGVGIVLTDAEPPAVAPPAGTVPQDPAGDPDVVV